ncbi:MFS transporter, partial [Sesbania bispinosa]
VSMRQCDSGHQQWKRRGRKKEDSGRRRGFKHDGATVTLGTIPGQRNFVYDIAVVGAEVAEP